MPPHVRGVSNTQALPRRLRHLAPLKSVTRLVNTGNLTAYCILPSGTQLNQESNYWQSLYLEGQATLDKENRISLSSPP